MGRKEKVTVGRRQDWLDGLRSPPHQWWDGVKGSVRSLGEKFPNIRTEKDATVAPSFGDKLGPKRPVKDSLKDRLVRKERPRSGLVTTHPANTWTREQEKTEDFTVRIKVGGAGSSPNLNYVTLQDQTEEVSDGDSTLGKVVLDQPGTVKKRAKTNPDGAVQRRDLKDRKARAPDGSTAAAASDKDSTDRDCTAVRDRFSFILPRCDRLETTVKNVRKDFGRLRSKSCDRLLKRHKTRNNAECLTGLVSELDEAYFQLNSIMRRSRRLQEKRLPYTGPYVGLARAKVDYVPSPYDTEGLPFKSGDLIHIICRRASGIWLGEVGGRTGNFKFINVEELEAPSSRAATTGNSLAEVTTVTGMLCKLELAHLTSRLVLNGWDSLAKLARISRRDLEYLGVEDGAEQDKLLTGLALRTEEQRLVLERVDSGYSDGLDSEESTYSEDLTRSSSTYSDEINRLSAYSDEVNRYSTYSDEGNRLSTYSAELARLSQPFNQIHASSIQPESLPSLRIQHSSDRSSLPPSPELTTSTSPPTVQEVYISPYLINRSPVHTPATTKTVPRFKGDLTRCKDDLHRSASLSSINQSNGESSSTLVNHDENLPNSPINSSLSSSVTDLTSTVNNLTSRTVSATTLNRLTTVVARTDPRSTCSMDDLDEAGLGGARSRSRGHRSVDYSVRFARTLLFSDDDEDDQDERRLPTSGSSITSSRLSIAEPTKFLNKSF